jgi:hypothetical protein
MRLAALTAAAAILSAGCGSKPITAHEVLFSDADTIKVQWDEILSSEANARRIAQEHCGDRQLQLVDSSSNAALYGLVKSRTWRCTTAAAK